MDNQSGTLWYMLASSPVPPDDIIARCRLSGQRHHHDCAVTSIMVASHISSASKRLCEYFPIAALGSGTGDCSTIMVGRTIPSALSNRRAANKHVVTTRWLRPLTGAKLVVLSLRRRAHSSGLLPIPLQVKDKWWQSRSESSISKNTVCSKGIILYDN